MGAGVCRRWRGCAAEASSALARSWMRADAGMVGRSVGDKMALASSRAITEARPECGAVGMASGRAAVFVDQAAEDVDAFDRPEVLTRDDRVVVHRWCGYREVPAEATVRSSGVVMGPVRGQHPVQVALVPDQDPVQRLGPYGYAPSVRRRRSREGTAVGFSRSPRPLR